MKHNHTLYNIVSPPKVTDFVETRLQFHGFKKFGYINEKPINPAKKMLAIVLNKEIKKTKQTCMSLTLVIAKKNCDTKCQLIH